MSIFKQLKADALAARKASDKLRASILIVLTSEIQAACKTSDERENPSDELTIAAIKKLIKSSNMVAESARDNIMAEVNAYKEITILESYLPKQLTEDEIKKIIQNLKNDADPILPADMKFIMGWFKEMCPGQYDGALVAKHAR